jgi:hypothetical protein
MMPRPYGRNSTAINFDLRGIVWCTGKVAGFSLLQPSCEISKACGLRPAWTLKYGRKNEMSPERLRAEFAHGELRGDSGEK